MAPAGRSCVATSTGRASLALTQKATDPARAARVRKTPMSARGSARLGRRRARADVRVATTMESEEASRVTRTRLAAPPRGDASAGRQHDSRPDRFRSSVLSNSMSRDVKGCQDAFCYRGVLAGPWATVARCTRPIVRVRRHARRHATVTRASSGCHAPPPEPSASDTWALRERHSGVTRSAEASPGRSAAGPQLATRALLPDGHACRRWECSHADHNRHAGPFKRHDSVTRKSRGASRERHRGVTPSVLLAARVGRGRGEGSNESLLAGETTSLN